MSLDLKYRMLCYEASRWVGMTEVGGDNKGQVVELFQKVIGGANREAWCLSFVMYCIKSVDDCYNFCRMGLYPDSPLKKTESTIDLWNSSSPLSKVNPSAGKIVIWEHYSSKGMRTGLGHAGIVIGFDTDGALLTIEGNTSPSVAEINRNGDGVYKKRRPLGDVGTMKLLGFLDPWKIPQK